MIDFTEEITADKLLFALDANAAKDLGFGAVFQNRWLFAQWEPDYIDKYQPSIDYLELYAMIVAMITWGDHLRNQRIIIFSDNTATVAMINSMTSLCKDCMYLLCLLTLDNLINNRHVFARHIRGVANEMPDALSRLQFHHFWKLAPPTMEKFPTKLSPLVWPASHIWQC